MQFLEQGGKDRLAKIKGYRKETFPLTGRLPSSNAMISRHNIGLFGYGIWGRKIQRDLIKLGARVFVSDLDSNKCKEALGNGAEGQLGQGYNLAAMDGFVVATPSSTHMDVLLELNAYQVPIFVEKPLATSHADALIISEAMHEGVFVMHVWKYHPGILLLAEIAASNELGTLLGAKSMRTNWTSPRTDIDSIWNAAPHDISIAETILGHIPEPRAALAECHAGVARGLFAFMGDDPWYVFEVSNRYPDKHRDVRIQCTEGIAVLENERVDYLEIFRGDHHSPPVNPKGEKRFFDSTPALYRELSAFVDYLDGGPAPPTSLQEGVAVVATIENLRDLAGV